LSIADLRKTGNEIERMSGGAGTENPFTGGVHGFFTKDGATQIKFLNLINLASERAPLRMLVSIPFRDV
jgi:hypothetical protein